MESRIGPKNVSMMSEIGEGISGLRFKGFYQRTKTQKVIAKLRVKVFFDHHGTAYGDRGYAIA